jgi:hypothetical protein
MLRQRADGQHLDPGQRHFGSISTELPLTPMAIRRKLCVISTYRAARPRRKCRRLNVRRSVAMPQSVYKVIEVIGTSPKSWEEAAKNAVELTGEHLRELRVAEVIAQDVVISANGKVEAYRTKLKVSFKYEGGH